MRLSSSGRLWMTIWQMNRNGNFRNKTDGRGNLAGGFSALLCKRWYNFSHHGSTLPQAWLRGGRGHHFRASCEIILTWSRAPAVAHQHRLWYKFSHTEEGEEGLEHSPAGVLGVLPSAESSCSANTGPPASCLSCEGGGWSRKWTSTSLTPPPANLLQHHLSLTTNSPAVSPLLIQKHIGGGKMRWSMQEILNPMPSPVINEDN